MLATLLVSWVLAQAPVGRPPPGALTLATDRVNVGPLELDVPADWRRTWRFGTSRFDAPTGEAYLLVDTSQTLTPNMDPSECVTKIVKNLGGASRWRPLEIDGFPAAEQLLLENSGNGSSQVASARYVGCDGNSTWSMMFSGDYRISRGRFEAVVKRVMESVKYGEKPGPTR